MEDPYELLKEAVSLLRRILEIIPDVRFWIEEKQYVKCGKQRCRMCSEGPGHKGPWYYLHYRDPITGKLKTRYLGKSPKIPTDLKVASSEELRLRRKVEKALQILKEV